MIKEIVTCRFTMLIRIALKNNNSLSFALTFRDYHARKWSCF